MRADPGFRRSHHALFEAMRRDWPGFHGFRFGDGTAAWIGPAGREWTPADLLAETTIPWAAEWLHFYELWHLCGEWLGPGVGHESIGHLRAEEACALRSMIAYPLEEEAA
jgi:hypothetical protein